MEYKMEKWSVELIYSVGITASGIEAEGGGEAIRRAREFVEGGMTGLPGFPSGKKNRNMTKPLMCRKKDRLPRMQPGKDEDMEYEKFKEEIRERMQERLGAGTEVSFRSLKRNNGAETEGLEVREESAAAAPVLHLDDLYGNYCGNGSMEETVSSALKMLEEKPPVDIGAVPRTWEAAKGRIRAGLLHYGWNGLKIFLNK